MRIIHGAGYSEEDRKGYIGQVHSNIFMAIKALVLAMNQLSIKYENSANQVLTMLYILLTCMSVYVMKYVTLSSLNYFFKLLHHPTCVKLFFKIVLLH